MFVFLLYRTLLLLRSIAPRNRGWEAKCEVVKTVKKITKAHVGYQLNGILPQSEYNVNF